MCGLTGIFNLNGASVSPVTLRGMANAIKHRGPDSEGFYIDSFIGIGHRRLSILDLSRAGHQPMYSADRNYVIAYNGEVYNYVELSDELKSLGYVFQSSSDTEVVLNAWVEWGENCVNRLNGMFAFVIWDKAKLTLHLVRDRYGIKPLYYTFHNNTFLFGSEQKALLAFTELKREVDNEALYEYFTFQNIFTDRTLLKGIHLLPSGCTSQLTLGEMRNSLDIKRYWDFSFSEPDAPLDENEAVEELDHLFKQAVRRQLVSDVDLGSYLSGGIDSGSITAIASKNSRYIKTFTCGFDLNSATGLEMGFDERETAEYMSYLFKTEHYEMVLKGGDMERILPQLAMHLEEPRIGQSYPNYYVAQLASKFVKVVLSGTGGDELFAGYPWRYYRSVGSRNFSEFVDNYFSFWQRLVPASSVGKVFKPIWNDVSQLDTKQIFKDVFPDHLPNPKTAEDYINYSLYFEAKTFLHGLLVVEDKLSMAHGLESRVPFLDNDLVDFAMRLPVHMKLGNLQEVVRLNENEPGNKTSKYFQKTNDGKLLLRKIMKNYAPIEISERQKQGFSAPDASWFKGDSIDYVKRSILNKDALIYHFLDFKEVGRLVNEHLTGKTNRRLLIWSLLNVEAWLHTYQ